MISMYLHFRGVCICQWFQNEDLILGETPEASWFQYFKYDEVTEPFVSRT